MCSHTDPELVRTAAIVMERASGLERQRSELALADERRKAVLEQALHNERLREAEAQISTLKARVVDLERDIERRGRENAALLNSRSWRLSTPWRAYTRTASWLGRVLRGIKVNPLFDPEWYLQQYPDVKFSEMDAYEHYLRRGAGEGRDPNPHFDTDWYLQQNADVRESRVNPLVHFYLHGAAEGRDPHPSFSNAQYSQMQHLQPPLKKSRSILGATQFLAFFQSFARARSGVRGNFDCIAYGAALGWVFRPRQPEFQFTVEILAGKQVVARGKACEFRNDLRSAGLGSGYSGFAVPLPPDVIDRPDDIVIRVVETGALLPKVGFKPMTSTTFGSFDGVHGYTVTGWALDLRSREPAKVEFLAEGKLIGVATANLFREDLQRAGIGNGVVAFRATLPISDPTKELEITARVQGSGVELDHSPRKFGLNRPIQRWLRRSSRLSREQITRLRRRLDAAIEIGLRLSIVMPVYNTDPTWLKEALDSVVVQWCGAWELICVDDASSMPHVREILERYSDLESRIKLIFFDKHAGISKATNAGIFAAKGDYVAFLDHDDYLEPDAVYKLLRAGKGNPELIYSDEIITEETLAGVASLIARPAFSYDYYLSHPYFVHIVCVRRDIALKVGGWDEDMKISGDVDFVLRVIEQCETITHIPAPLYRWRTHSGSAGHQMKNAVMEATIGAIARHLKRLDIPASVKPGPTFNQFRIDFEDGGGKVGIIIPTRNRVDLLRTCIESIERTVDMTQVKIVIVNHESDDPDTLGYLRRSEGRHVVMAYSGPFNFSEINNLAVDEYTGDCEYLLFMNNDIEAIQSGWLERMRSLAGRRDVGVVGATLLYGDNTIQHAGVIGGLNGPADHAHKFAPFMNGADRNRGYNGSLTSVRDYSAVTAACMMMRREVFIEVGKFDERLAIGFGDTDLCLRTLSAGYKILNDAFSVLFHHESATRAKTMQLQHPVDTKRFTEKWPQFARGDGDVFYNPTLTLCGAEPTVVERCNAAVGRSRSQMVVLPQVQRRSAPHY